MCARSNNPSYERVPYAFAFRGQSGKTDFVLISVHLDPRTTLAGKKRRQEELGSIVQWINDHDEKEKDFIILGDMNIQSKKEYKELIPAGYISLNDEYRPTNTNVHSRKPFDHVMYRPEYTPEIDTSYDLVVIDLVKEMKDDWTKNIPYPGKPYIHDQFRQYYSDHDPVVFRIKIMCDND